MRKRNPMLLIFIGKGNMFRSFNQRYFSFWLWFLVVMDKYEL